jgi:Arc/MetJ-type ribon-helix-helix transcriptional regulator
MANQIPADIDERVSALLATGRYESRDDVLRAAILALELHRDEVTAIQEGIDDMEAGRVMPLREFDRDFRERNNIA